MSLRQNKFQKSLARLLPEERFQTRMKSFNSFN